MPRYILNDPHSSFDLIIIAIKFQLMNNVVFFYLFLASLMLNVVTEYNTILIRVPGLTFGFLIQAFSEVHSVDQAGRKIME